MAKYLFFSGKGGVGKTTMAAASAIYYAQSGAKTLIVTTDPASNLADVFEQEIGHKVTPIKGVDKLFAMEIDPDEATREYKEKVIGPFKGYNGPYNSDRLLRWKKCYNPQITEVRNHAKEIQFRV
jgi:arsenite-transporting ATPase